MARKYGDLTAVAAVRLDADVAAELDELVEVENARLRRECSPGQASRSAMLRVLVALGMDAWRRTQKQAA